jgi:hypothetical protein
MRALEQNERDPVSNENPRVDEPRRLTAHDLFDAVSRETLVKRMKEREQSAAADAEPWRAIVSRRRSSRSARKLKS